MNTESETKTAQILVFGRVQGVFYRAFVQQQARALGLRGWTRNLSDGSVEVCAQGETDKILALSGRCREGPPAAWVEDVRISWIDQLEIMEGFYVRY